VATRTLLKDKEIEKEVHQCPLPTHDLHINLRNRLIAFKEYGYGPANPDAPAKEFWNRKSIIWNCTETEAKTMRCGNCSAFIQTSQMFECIKAGIEAKDPRMEAGYDEDVIEAANLGYCELLHFKCAGTRTCDAWLVGGPITDKNAKSEKDD
jgi:hypothetical protein